MEQVPPKAASVPQLGGAGEKLKSPGLVPPIVIVPGTKGVLVLFVSVKIWAALSTPGATKP